MPVIGDIPTDPCSAAMSAFIGIITLEAEGFDHLAKDPPDPRYRKIAEARVRVPISYRGSGDVAKIVAALNALTANAARASAYQAALLTSVERQQGARAAKQAGWARKQTKAARRFAGLAATALSASPAAIRRLASALKAAGYAGGTLSPADAAALQAEVVAGGLPKGIDAALNIIGVTSTAREQLRSGVQAAAPGDLAAVGFPEILTKAELLASIRSAAAALRRLARG